MCQHFLLWITALVSYLRTPHIGLDLEDFPLSFLMKILKLYIEIHDPFLINFVGCEVLSQSLIFCPIDVQLFQYHLLKRLSFFY